MKPMGRQEELPFLEPPHSHDVTSVSHLASIPTSMLEQLPTEIQDALWTLQESTSVVYASYNRLQDIISDRLDRLTTLPNDPTAFNEGAFFTYQGQLNNERTYLLDECIPDWKHKFLHVDLEKYYDLAISHSGCNMTVRDWIDRLQSKVLCWASEARAVEVPGFEDTTIEYKSQSTTPTSDVSEDSLEGNNAVRNGNLNRDCVLLRPSKYRTGFGREIEKAMGVSRADSW